MEEEKTKKKSAKATKPATTQKQAKKKVEQKQAQPASKQTKTKQTAKRQPAPKQPAQKRTKAVEEKEKVVSKTKTTQKTAKKQQKNTKNVKNSQKTQQKADKKPQTKTSNEPQKIVGFHDLSLNTYIYDDVKSPKAVVVIVHGMMEHALRYKAFAEFLNKNGYIVIANDLRGHGLTAESVSKRGFGEEDIFQETLKDELIVINYASQKYNLPVYVFGHSYGSMISQYLIQISQQIEKCVISGTTNGNALNMKSGALFARILSPFKNKNSAGGIIEKIVIKSFEKGFARGNWLTRDEQVFDAYNKDEYCGGSFPFSFYKSLMLNMAKVNSGINKIGRKKIFLIVGDKDPVGQKSKQVKKLYNLYLENNVDVKLKVYPDARHELINETNKAEVYQDVLNFFNS